MRKRWRFVWSWPRGKMAWFFCGRRSSIWPEMRLWRIGPLTLQVDD